MDPSNDSTQGNQPPEQPTGDVGGVNVTQPTTPDAPSEAGAAGATDHSAGAATPELSPEQLAQALEHKDAQAVIYRLAQSMADKRQAALEQKRQEEAEKKRIAAMDDEEYGRHLRLQEAQQRQAQIVAERALRTVLEGSEEAIASHIGDKTLREQFVADARAGKYATLADYVGAVLQAESERRVTQALAKSEPQMREAARKDAQAEQADTFAPTLGRGAPTSGRQMEQTTTDLGVSFGEELVKAEKKQKGGGS